MKVLIVDDNADDRKLLRLNLERHGCETVIEGRDGLEGLDLARAHRPDLIISDALMPRMDGFEFLRRVKTNEELKDIPFVFHSSVYTGLNDEKLASHLDAEAFITKPKEPEEFWREIAAVLERLAAGRKKPPPAKPLEEEQEFLREYSGVVAAKLELKVRELEESLARRREAEEALLKSERFLNSIIENIPDMIFVKDARELRFMRFNKAGEELLGYTREELTGKNDYDLFPRHEADIFTAKDRKVINNGRLEDVPEETIRTRNKGTRVLHTKKIPVPDETGTPQYLLGISEDITERKQAEETQKKLEAQLLHSQKMEAVGLLAGGVAHDFNNMLMAIIGYGNLLQMKMSADDPLRANVDKILTAADRAAGLTQSLLTFSRKQVINLQPVNLNEIIRKVEKFLARIIGEDIEIHTTFSEDPLIVNADSGQIEQVLMNLATNARDAMPQGGSLSIVTKSAEIDHDYIKAHGYGESGRYALFSVTDSGTGMDEATAKRIFEPFFTTKEIGKGTGLGLSIVYGIVKQHGGYIDVYSQQGKGTTFRAQLPLLKSGEPDGTEPPQPQPKEGTETILLAEDEAEIRKLETEVFTEFGYTVIEAVDGEDAVCKFKEHRERIQLLLFDLIMPKKNGKEAYDEIRQMGGDVRAIFVSGYPLDIAQRKGILAEGIDLIIKPVSPQILLRKIREVLDR